MKIEVISASAGTGKTYTLASRMEEAIESGEVRPEAVFAITYTKKAAAEIASRLRKRLIKGGQPEAASRVRDGYVGTVHSICQRLISELAFEVGCSPYPIPAPDSYSNQLFQEIVGTITKSNLPTLTPLSQSLGMPTDDSRKSARYKAMDWRTALLEIVTLARENRLDQEALKNSARHSLSEVKALLAKPIGDIETRDAELWAGLQDLTEWAKANVQSEEERKGKASTTAYKQLKWCQRLNRLLERGDYPSWSDLAGVNSMWNTKKVAEASQPLRDAVARHLSHPRLHDEIAEMLELLFGCAHEANLKFTERKQSERLLDFGDMLADAAQLLQKPEVRTLLHGRIDLLMVDEFQDTSPVQLELILALSSIAKKTVWVGDRKQAIFGFQGSDPALVDAAFKAVLADAEPETLNESFRSRKPLVEFCSELFATALKTHGVSRKQVVLESACPEPAELEGKPALHLWRLVQDKESKENLSAHAIARKIKAIVDGGELIIREESDDPRELASTQAVRAGDIAVLARTNKECVSIATSLKAFGVPAELALDGLGETPEALLLASGLTLLVDPSDSLAAAEVAWFTGNIADPNGWLSQRIDTFQKSKEEKTYPPAFQDIDAVNKVRALSERFEYWSPEEAVLALFGALDLPRLVLSWPDPRQHLANLDNLRAQARDYETISSVRRVAATIRGFIRHLKNLPSGIEQAGTATTEAVRVSTYHKAKGMEWPVVICSSLETDYSVRLFTPRIEPAVTFDANTPLTGREIRWWLYPYGKKQKDIAMFDRAHESDKCLHLSEADTYQNIRLLYVGLTRARDHLIFAINEMIKTPPTAWVDLLRDENGEPSLILPTEREGAHTVTVGSHQWSCTVSEVAGSPPDAAPLPARARWFRAVNTTTNFQPQALRPSEVSLTDEEKNQVEPIGTVKLGGRIKLKSGGEMNRIGDMIHLMLAGGPGEATVATAQTLLDHSALGAYLNAQDLLDISSRFEGWLSTYVGATRYTEWPVRWVRTDGRLVTGEIDLLMETEKGFILVDHKTFPGDTALRDERLKKWAGQLSMYRGAIEAAGGKTVTECWIHLPIRGEMVRVEVPRGELEV